MAKKGLRVFILLLLLGAGVGLFFSKEISHYVEDWKNRGANEARVSLPPPIEEGANVQIPNKGTAGQVGIAPPDFGNIFGLGGQNGSAELGGNLDNLLNTTVQGGSNATAQPDSNDNSRGLAYNPTNATNATNATSAIGAESFSHGASSLGIDGVEVSTESGQPARVGGFAPPLHEDMVVSRRFVDAVAHSLVNSFYPAGTSPANPGSGGYSTLNLRSLNVNYGVETQGYFKKGRLETLNYVMAPSMLEALYRLYIDDFMLSMQAAANRDERDLGGIMRALNKAEQREMYEYYAKRASGLSAVFEATAASPVIAEKLDVYYLAAVEALQKNNAFMQATQNKQENTNSVQAVSTYNQAAKEYQSSVQKRERAYDALLSSLKRYPGVRNLNDSDVIYAAAWIHRRLADGSAEAQSIATAARIFDNLALRLRLASEQ